MSLAIEKENNPIIQLIANNNKVKSICKHCRSANTFEMKLKRMFDVIFALFVLILLSPIFIIISLAIKIISPDGPVFFAHKRIGLQGKEFDCLKFRTMQPNAEELLYKLLQENNQLKSEFSTDFKFKKDPRIIPIIGEFLRKSSFDELPQFLNSLMGNMSVVGPRPIIYGEIGKYGRELPKLLSIKPGITGLWQVSGRNNVSYSQRVTFDMTYVDKHNFLMDIKIIFKTILVVLFRDGAY